jgi:acyl-CoA synthetase (AMP-forming)/AMP-acid ligase II
VPPIQDIKCVADLVDVWSTTSPAERAYTFLECGDEEGTSMTWSDVRIRSHAIAGALAGVVEPGSRALLLFPPGLDFIPAFFGTLKAGGIAVPSYPPSGSADRLTARLRGIVGDADVAVILTTSSLRDRAGTLCALVPELASRPWIAVDDLHPGSGTPCDRFRTNEDDVALLQYTSGSTSSPRGVMVTHRNLLDNLQTSARLGRHDRHSVSVSWLPVSHDMGLIQGVLQPAYSGCAGYLMAPLAFLQRPARWLRAISRVRATHSGAPNFAYDLCTRRLGADERRALDLRSWRVAFNGSEPVGQATLDAFERAFSECGFRRDAFRPAYGLAEATLLVTTTADGAEPQSVSVDEGALRHGRIVPVFPSDAGQLRQRAARTLVACGSPPSGMRVEIVDPAQHTRCAPGQIGEIWVAGASVTRGYWNRPIETDATFAARLAETGEGPFLRTGDLGFQHRGQLVIAGRLKDVLIVRGLKHHPHDIESSVEAAHPAIRRGCTAAFAVTVGDERVAIAAEIERPHSGADASSLGSVTDAIRSAVARAHGIDVCAVALLHPGGLPKTTSGKVQRYACRDGLMAGELSALSVWSIVELGADTPLERTA